MLKDEAFKLAKSAEFRRVHVGVPGVANAVSENDVWVGNIQVLASAIEAYVVKRGTNMPRELEADMFSRLRNRLSPRDTGIVMGTFRETWAEAMAKFVDAESKELEQAVALVLKHGLRAEFDQLKEAEAEVAASEGRFGVHKRNEAMTTLRDTAQQVFDRSITIAQIATNEQKGKTAIYMSKDGRTAYFVDWQAENEDAGIALMADEYGLTKVQASGIIAYRNAFPDVQFVHCDSLKAFVTALEYVTGEQVPEIEDANEAKSYTFDELLKIAFPRPQEPEPAPEPAHAPEKKTVYIVRAGYPKSNSRRRTALDGVEIQNCTDADIKDIDALIWGTEFTREKLVPTTLDVYRLDGVRAFEAYKKNMEVGYAYVLHYDATNVWGYAVRLQDGRGVEDLARTRQLVNDQGPCFRNSSLLQLKALNILITGFDSVDEFRRFVESGAVHG